MFMKVTSYGKSVAGSVHEKEDEILVDDKLKLYAVADGVTLSSQGKGDVAAKKCIEYLKKFISKDLKKTFEVLNKTIVNEKLNDITIGETTLTALKISDKNIQVANVGDSPVFLFRNNKLKQLTELDSIGSMLTQAIGFSDIKVHFSKVSLKENDYFILASDGITNNINENKTIKIIKEFKEPKKIVEKIVHEVENKEKAYDDDKSIIVIFIKSSW